MRLRRTIIRIFQIAGIFLVVLDVVLYFGMFRTLQTLASSEEQQFTAVRRRILEAEVRIEKLKDFRGALPEAGNRLEEIERDYAPPRRQGFSQAAKLVRRVTGPAGTQLVSVAYKLDNTTAGPLQRLDMVINVEGPFPALLKFAHALETASDFIVIRNFNITETDTSALEMRLAADLYLTP